MEHPALGSRSITSHFKRKGFKVNRKRISRLMELMGIEAIYRKPKRKNWLTKYEKFPYLLKDYPYRTPNEVWAIDITYIPMKNNFIYLVAIMDVYSRYVLTWKLSNSMESPFCIYAIEKALKIGTPLIFNSDQGTQFTSHDYVRLLKRRNIQISMSGTGKCWDNIFIERFWKTLKYEEVYLNQYETIEDALESIGGFIFYYNNHRPHTSLNNKTPAEVYKEKNENTGGPAPSPPDK